MARDRRNTVSVSERMAMLFVAIARDRQAKIEDKLQAGYRPRLDDRGNVVLVKVKRREG